MGRSRAHGHDSRDALRGERADGRVLSRVEERLFTALHQRAQREAKQLFLAEGVRIAEDLLAAGLAIELAAVSPSLEDTPRGQSLHAALTGATVVRRVSAGVLRRIAATDAPQGVVIVARTPITELDQLDTGEDGTGLVFDAIQDPGNLGTLVRSADAFGARFAIALEGTVDPWNPKAVRSAAGSSFRVPIAQATIDRALDWLRSHSFRLLVADAAGTPVDSITRGQRTALVIGNEGSGVRAAVRAAAHTTVAVPVRGHVESLNAAVAGSVLLYLLTR